MKIKYNNKLVVISVIAIFLFAAAVFSLGRLQEETPVVVADNGITSSEESAMEENSELQKDGAGTEKERAKDQSEEESDVISNLSADTTPITTANYTVKSGDTLFLISQRAKVTVNHLISLNGLKSDTIYVGQQLKIKGQIVKQPSSSNQTASRSGIREDDLYWLSRIIHAEAQGEPYKGKVAVGNVIVNRVKSSLFPNTIYGVVFDKQHGYTQFSPVIDGSIYNSPGAESINAAKAVLNGESPVGNALYFLNPRKATNFWIVQNREFFMTIGDHDFYH